MESLPEIPRIGFDNRNNPQSSFDMVNLSFPSRTRFDDHDPRSLHQITFFILIVVTEGKGKHTIDFRDYSYERGSLLTIRKDQIHKFHDGVAEGYVLLFTEDFIVSYLEKQEAHKTLRLFNEWLGSPQLQLSDEDLGEVSSLVRHIQKEYQEVKDSYSAGIIRSLLHILISKLYRLKARIHEDIHSLKYLEPFLKFQELVEKNCFVTKKVTDYADMMAVSRKTLNNIVQSVLHKSAKKFIDEILITQIKRLLVNSTLSVKEIAFQAGFEDPSNLYKYFKKYTRLTPEGFREQHA